MVEPLRTPKPDIQHPIPEVRNLPAEQQAEKFPVAVESQPEVQPVDLVPPPHVAPAPVAIHSPTDQLVKNIETAMADGLDDAYSAMDAATQQKFKETGEVTASAISQMLQQSKIQVKKIVILLLRWLKLIPQVNPYYLEQQAKIKADAIVALRHPPRVGN